MLFCLLSSILVLKAQEKPVNTILKIRPTTYNNGIQIYFEPEHVDKPLILYRHIRPITSVQELVQSVIVSSGIVQSPFLDYPVPGVSYYYAIFFEKDIQSGTITIVPGQNISLIPVQVPLDKNQIGLPPSSVSMRTQPLPLLSSQIATADIDNTHILIIPAYPLSEAAAKAVNNLPYRERRKQIILSPTILKEEQENINAGEAYVLQSLVFESFPGAKWDSFIQQGEQFLSLPRSKKIEARVHFYLGQAYLFSGKPKEALFNFLSSQDEYPEQTAPWIQETLAQLILS